MVFPDLSLDLAVRLAALIAGLGILWDTAEFLIYREQTTNFFNWDLIKTRYYFLARRPWLEATFDAVCEDGRFKYTVLAHALAAVLFVVFFPWAGAWTGVLALGVLAGHCLAHLRLFVGLDGADQMQGVVWAGIAVYAFDLGTIAQYAAVGFIAVQLVLSYLTSGMVKVVSDTWVRGEAVSRVMRAATYGPPTLAKWMQTSILTRFFSWSTIAFELGSPALLLFGLPGTVAFLVIAFLFHVGVALAMGLTTFVFAFSATYPIVYALMTKIY